MKKTFLFAATVAMACAFVSCDDTDDCGVTPAPPAQVTVGSSAEVQNALNQGVTTITLTEPLTGDANFSIPNAFAPNQQLTLEIPAGDNDITITQDPGHGGVYPTLNLNADDVENLTINTPNMSVNYSGTVNGVLTASTALTTLTLASNSVVGTLNVNRGNVYSYGTVGTYGTLAEGVKIIRPVSTAEELRTMLAGTEPYNGGVVLTADIHYVMPTISGIQANQNAFVIGSSDYKDSESTAFDPELDQYDGYIFDGNGHTIGGAAWNNVMIVFANNAVIKNLKVEQNTADRDALTAASRGNNGITVYRSKGVKLENVTVNSTQKAGVVISSSTVVATKLTTNGNTWGGVNISGGIFPSGGGKPELTYISGTLNEAAKIWVDLNTLGVEGYSVTTPAGWTSSIVGTQAFYYPEE